MKGGSSKVVMGAAMVIVVTLALVLALVLLLLAELYCSLFLRTRGNHRKRPNSASAADPEQLTARHPHAPSLCSFYYQGVLPAPRSFLFPAAAPEKQQPAGSPALSAISAPVEHLGSPSSAGTATSSDGHPMYICNPIYDLHETLINGTTQIPKADTPFETPGTSPSRLEEEDDDDSPGGSHSATPPLTPMKKLPAEGPSVSLRDAGSICTTGSDSNSNYNYNNGLISISSSSSSDSERASPS
ncbi:uncharacterized protein LOC127251970 isoform X2 [Andrographis paniculata]|nr:uncharacterized protein LOC127251970 isoform X2 [Andrographis paniculata]